MGEAKKIVVKAINATAANEFIKAVHYSGKVVPNSQLHLGVYYLGGLHGVMQFGPSINKKGTINLVEGTQWNEFIELNRMAFDKYLPRNSESRALRIAMILFRKYKPNIKWVISFADATRCGTGTIYRAAGFKLVGIAENTALRIDPRTKEVMHIIQAHHKKISSKEFHSWDAVKGYQIKYVYFLDPAYEAKLQVPILPYSELDKLKLPNGVRHKEYLKTAPVT